MKRYNAHAVAGALAIVAGLAPVYAPAQQANERQMAQPGVGNINWNEREIRGGISLNRLVGMDVTGKNGKSLGEVQHVLLNTSGKVTAIVVESGGFLNIGDTHFRIPWKEVQFGRDMDHVVVPLSEQTAERYRERRTTEQVQTGAREFRFSELKDDAVTLRDGTRYGQVDDLVVTRGGDVKAMVVDADFENARGAYAYPYSPDAFAFDRNTYTLPYDRAQVVTVRPFSYAAMNIAEPRAGTGATGSTGAAGQERGGTRAARQTRG